MSTALPAAAAAVCSLLLGSAVVQESPATQPATRPATQPTDAGPLGRVPYTLERFERDGPIRGVVAKIDLTDPRVKVVVALSGDEDPDGPGGKAVARLDTVSGVAMRRDFELTMNASFFAVTGSRVVLGKKVGYFVGNGGYPVGWHYSNGQTYGTPAREGLRSTMIVHNDGRITLQDNVMKLPADVAYAVSGNAKMLVNGQVVPPEKDADRHPRSAVGLSADGKTLILLVVDGRRPGYSRGTTIAETGELLREFGAAEGINLDGGGSSALAVKDVVTGAFTVVNQPSERFALVPAVDVVQRPVVDVVGIDIRDE